MPRTNNDIITTADVERQKLGEEFKTQIRKKPSVMAENGFDWQIFILPYDARPNHRNQPREQTLAAHPQVAPL